jgi:2-keto-3-deoxy-L-rhamnonate aldolase RhmA
MTDLRSRVKAGETLYGTFLCLGSPLAAEACALAGFDWLLVDLEHGSGDEGVLVHQQLAADAHGVPVLVRVESDHGIRAGRVLDIGAAGVMFPRLRTAGQAALAVRHLRYPPLGDRGVATSTRACGFGLHPEALADRHAVCVVQIENRPAVEAIEEIAAVEGIDVLFVGPRDLTHDLGVPGDTAAPEFRDAVKRVRAAADAAGVAVGVLAPDEKAARRYADEGFRFIGVGSDASLLVHAGKHVADVVRS